MKRKKRDFIGCTAIALCFLIFYIAMAYHFVYKDHIALENWDAGKKDTFVAVCEDFYFYNDTSKGNNDRWVFILTDGQEVSITANVRTGFDEDSFRALVGQELEFTCASPGGAIMNISANGTELLDTEYMRHCLVSSRSSGIYLMMGQSLVLMFFIGGAIWAGVDYFKSRKQAKEDRPWKRSAVSTGGSSFSVLSLS